jgi:hypothetical protein
MLLDNTMEDEGRQKKVEAGRAKVIFLRILVRHRIDYAHLILPCWYDIGLIIYMAFYYVYSIFEDYLYATSYVERIRQG